MEQRILLHQHQSQVANGLNYPLPTTRRPSRTPSLVLSDALAINILGDCNGECLVPVNLGDILALVHLGDLGDVLGDILIPIPEAR